MENFEAKWRDDCEANKKVILDRKRKFTDADIARNRVIGNLRAFIDEFKRNASMPPDEILSYADGKDIIDNAIMENNRQIDNATRSGSRRNLDEFRDNIRILQEYRGSF